MGIIYNENEESVVGSGVGYVVGISQVVGLGCGLEVGQNVEEGWY